MAKNEVVKESEVWNIAQGYSVSHFLMALIECRKLIMLSLFGVEYVEEQSTFPEQLIARNRVNAIERLIEVLVQICDDSDFVMKKDNKEKMIWFRSDILKVKECISAIKKIENDTRTKVQVLVINEKHFSISLDILRKNLALMKTPLNDENLIFPSSDSEDLDDIMETIIKGG